MRTIRIAAYTLLVPLLVGLALVACSGAVPTPPTANTVALIVDTALTPPVATLPALGGSPRPVAVLVDDDGSRAAFVADELWLSTDDRDAVDALLARWNGTILLELDPEAAGVGGLPRQYLVRIDPTLADVAGLPADLAAIDADATGSGSVSSAAGLGLLAASAHEAASGHDVGVNWIGEGADVGTQSVADKTLTEAPSGPTLGGVAYTPNPFAWPTHDVGSAQDIGVAEAWRALDAAGRLIPSSVSVAILDMGFEPDADMPAGFVAISNVPFVNPIGTENLLSCSGPCPWHGTNVASAAFAVPDNGYGSAGPAGPVADPVLVFTSYDFFTSVAALIEARALGARIANMSYSAAVPSFFAVSVLPFEAATIALRAAGMLLFAAAGNDDKNVDAEARDPVFGIGLGFESTWYTPCENAGVICVGGVAPNSLSRDGGSNFGAEQVDVFAPYTLWLGPDPEAPANAVRRKSGTSYSSPFVAGIAALVWAADLAQSASDVEDALLDNAKTSPDDEVGRVVDALGAVRSVLGNVPPTIDVVRPSPGDELDLNATVFFDAIVTDFEDGIACCVVTWTSNVDGQLGTGRGTSSTFTTVGPRTITITAVDAQGAQAIATIPVTVANTAPTVDITKPVPEDDVFQGASTVLRGTSFDRNEPGAELACAALAWTSSNPGDGDFPVSGCEVQVVFGTLGTRTLTLTGVDPQGASATDTAVVTVLDPPPDLPPSVLITNPENFQSVQTDEQITLTGDVTDPEGATPLTLVWTVAVNGGPPEQVGTGNNVLWTPNDTIDFSGEDRYDVTIRLTAQDPGGNSGNDFVQLRFIIIN